MLVIAAAAAGGCAVGQQIPYNQMPRVQMPGTGRVALVVQDWRDEILSGAKPPNFCGTLRGGYGNPFNVTTASTRPLAADFATVIARALSTSGFRVVMVPTLKGLAPGSADRSLLIQIADWKSDTYKNTALIYRVTAQVRDAQGRVIAQSQIVGNDDLGGDFWNPGNHMKAAVPPATRIRLERLLNDPALATALRSDAAQVQPSKEPDEDEIERS